MTATYTTGISDSLANLLNDNGTAINDNVTAAAGDDADIKITITDDSTSITAVKLSLITAATEGTVTLSNSHTITGTGAELKAALETDAVTAAAGTTATVSDAVTVSVANSISGATNVTAAFTNGISDALANLASDGNPAGGLTTAAGDDTNVNITITGEEAGTKTISQLGSDIDAQEADEMFGNSTAISSDGSIIAVGAFGHDGAGGSNSGTVRIYQYSSGSWNQLGSDIDGDQKMKDRLGILAYPFQRMA